MSHVLSDYATLEFVGIGLKGVDDEPYEEQLARAIIDDNPPLQKIAADIRKMNLDIDESITVALAAAKKHFEEMYGPLIPECFAVLNAVVRHLQSTSEDVRRIAEQVGKSGVEPAALDRDAAADYLGIETKTMDYLVRRRKIRFVQVGDQRGRVFRISDLDGFLNENVELTADEILRVRKPK